MNAIVNISPEWGIGTTDRLLVHIHADMRHFRSMTQQNTIIFGRKTLATFPNGDPLPKRNNIVMTRNRNFQKPGLTVCHDLNELKACLMNVDPNTVFVCGGEQIYWLLLPYCKRSYVTLTETSARADRYFPNLNRLQNWTLSETGDRQSEDGVYYRFMTYVNLKPEIL